MTYNPILITTGTIGGAPILADIGSNGPRGTAPGRVLIELSEDYTLIRPSCYPTRFGQDGTGFQDVTGEVIPAGWTILLLYPEAQAIVAANGGTITDMAPAYPSPRAIPPS